MSKSMLIIGDKARHENQLYQKPSFSWKIGNSEGWENIMQLRNIVVEYSFLNRTWNIKLQNNIMQSDSLK